MPGRTVVLLAFATRLALLAASLGGCALTHDAPGWSATGAYCAHLNKDIVWFEGEDGSCLAVFYDAPNPPSPSSPHRDARTEPQWNEEHGDFVNESSDPELRVTAVGWVADGCQAASWPATRDAQRQPVPVAQPNYVWASTGYGALLSEWRPPGFEVLRVSVSVRFATSGEAPHWAELDVWPVVGAVQSEEHGCMQLDPGWRRETAARVGVPRGP